MAFNRPWTTIETCISFCDDYYCFADFSFFFCRFLSMRTQRNNNNRTHTHVKYNKLSTSARNERISQSRKQRTTTLAIPADDESNLMPNEPQSDFDDDEHPSI